MANTPTAVGGAAPDRGETSPTSPTSPSLFTLGTIDLFAPAKRGRRPAAKDAATAEGGSPAPVPRAPTPARRLVFTPVAILILTKTQLCSTCGSTTDYVEGEFVVEAAASGELAKSGYRHWREAHPGEDVDALNLPVEVLNASTTCRLCPSCLTLSRIAGTLQLFHRLDFHLRQQPLPLELP